MYIPMQNILITCIYIYIAELTKFGGTPLQRAEKFFGKTNGKTAPSYRLSYAFVNTVLGGASAVFMLRGPSSHQGQKSKHEE